MDPIQNPFAPGAGTPPPELTGRDELLATVHVAMARICAGRHAKSVLMVGLRGVGKTVLLDRMRDRNCDLHRRIAVRGRIATRRVNHSAPSDGATAVARSSRWSRIATAPWKNGKRQVVRGAIV